MANVSSSLYNPSINNRLIQQLGQVTHLIPRKLTQVTEAQQLALLRQHLAVLIHCRLGAELLHQASFEGGLSLLRRLQLSGLVGIA